MSILPNDDVHLNNAVLVIVIHSIVLWGFSKFVQPFLCMILFNFSEYVLTIILI